MPFQIPLRTLQPTADSLSGAAGAPFASPADSLAALADSLRTVADSLRGAAADTSGILEALGLERQSAPVEAVGNVFDGLVRALHNATGFSALAVRDLLLSALVVVVLWAVRLLVLTLVYQRVKDVRVRYRWRKSTSYGAFVLGALVLLRIWVGALGALATFFGLLSAGVAIALRDPLVNVVGWLYIVWKRPFVPGDRIAIRAHLGDVIDQRVSAFTLLEVGAEAGAGQSTGRIIHVPNGWVFTDSVVNATEAFPYIWNELTVAVPFEADWRKAKRVLLALVEEHAEVLSEEAERQLRRAAQEHMIFYSKLTPTVYTSVAGHGVQLTLRYLVEPRRRRGSEEVLWEAILDAFDAEPDLAFAYPTNRTFRQNEEGKPGLRPEPPPAPDAPANLNG